MTRIRTSLFLAALMLFQAAVAMGGMPRPDREDKSGCDMGAYESQSD